MAQADTAAFSLGVREIRPKSRENTSTRGTNSLSCSTSLLGSRDILDFGSRKARFRENSPLALSEVYSPDLWHV